MNTYKTTDLRGKANVRHHKLDNQRCCRSTQADLIATHTHKHTQTPTHTPTHTEEKTWLNINLNGNFTLLTILFPYSLFLRLSLYFWHVFLCHVDEILIANEFEPDFFFHMSHDFNQLHLQKETNEDFSKYKLWKAVYPADMVFWP